MDEKMKVIGRQMSLRMGLLMSFSLALVGTVTSGHFTIPGFLISFALSAVISIIIGFVVPVGKVSESFCRRRNLAPGTLPYKLASAFISDLIYTPVITLAMVCLAYFMAKKQSGGMAQIPFLPMFLKSLVITFIVGFVLIYIFMPLFLNQLMKKHGIGPGGAPRGDKKDH
ncbi:MAG: hypothetical protein IJ695_04115 [Butyrivibrio sp.]|nr:hypothetical protein [Butyrivibrio sp.]